MVVQQDAQKRLSMESVQHGNYLRGFDRRVLSHFVGPGKRPRTTIGGSMNALYVIGGLIALALLVYLVVALLKPEAF